MEKRLGAAEFGQRLPTGGRLVAKRAQPPQQAIPQRQPFRSKLDRWRPKLFQQTDRVANIRGIEMDAPVAAPIPAFRQEWMSREPGVELGNQFRSGLHGLRIRTAG